MDGNAEILKAITDGNEVLRKEFREEVNLLRKDIRTSFSDRDNKCSETSNSYSTRIDAIEREIIIFKASIKGMKILVGFILAALTWITINIERIIGFFGK